MSCFLGVDIGGTKVAFRAEGADGQAHEAAFRWPERHSAERDLAWLGERSAEFGDLHGPQFAAVGVALPATVDAAGRVTAWPSRPEWPGVDVGAALSGLFPDTSVAWADDGGLGALAEARTAGSADVLYIGVGTGIGGGLVLGGVPYPAPGGAAFEIGHVVVRSGGDLCVCGRRGCLQAAASGPATLARAARLRGAPVAFDELCSGIRGEQDWAVAAVDESCAAVAAAVTSVVELLHPSLALIGGGSAAALPGFVERVAAHVDGLARAGFPAVPVRPAVWGGLSSLRGAVWLARSAARTPDEPA